MKYFIANWKANKNLEETRSWVNDFLKNIEQNPQTKEKIDNNRIKIILCPPFSLIAPLKKMLEGQKNISVGSQDVSLVEGGTYTGEVTAHSLESLAEYTIIGHSERKKFLRETDGDVLKKYENARKHDIEPIYCIAQSTASYPESLRFLCYEPPTAISTGDGRGKNETLETILEAKKQLKVRQEIVFIYGGSVNKDNAAKYLSSKEIDGFLSGGASLDPFHFYQIISFA